MTDETICLVASIQSGKKQEDVAESYAFYLLHYGMTENVVDWRVANAEIRKRWPKGLGRVKTMAWRIVEKRERAIRGE